MTEQKTEQQPRLDDVVASAGILAKSLNDLYLTELEVPRKLSEALALVLGAARAHYSNVDDVAATYALDIAATLVVNEIDEQEAGYCANGLSFIAEDLLTVEELSAETRADLERIRDAAAEVQT
jgi:hypothetical protein